MTRTIEELERIRTAVGVRQELLRAGPLPAGVMPLEIHCHWSACAHGRHSLDHYRNAGGRGLKYPPGYCQDCGERIADLPQPGEVMPLDDDQFFAAFNQFPKELIRAHYWNVRFDLRAHHQAWRLGRVGLMERARKRVLDSMLINDRFKGQRAPYREKIVAYAQHATAGCCRQCASYWHGLPKDMTIRPGEEQLEYVIALVQSYLDLRFPDLPDEPTLGVPNVPKDAGPDDEEVRRMEDHVLASFAKDADPVGLVIPTASRLKLISGHDGTGGYVEPGNIELALPPFPKVG